MRDPEAIRQVLSDLEAELVAKQAEVETLQSGIAALKLMLKGSQAVASGHAPSSGSGPSAVSSGREEAGSRDADGPRGREAVMVALSENPGQWVTIQELTETLVDRGWVESDKPREAVRTSADRLAKDPSSPVEKGRGKYRLQPTAVRELRTATDHQLRHSIADLGEEGDGRKTLSE